jgi:hypothetical protein
VAASLERAELVDVLARRDIAKGKGLADHPRRSCVQQKYSLYKDVSQATLEKNGGERRGRDFLEPLAAFGCHWIQSYAK